ncbi:PilZ domain-containing protein [Bacillus songklensis]|uniref:PilZ domain-containing protein n=1 Tax=Bacillus songklensis TaxID=1069116 RepID=A0ABV8B6S2_9BACI
MRYRREESFRYKFITPLYCFYSIGNKEEQLKDGKILDLSPNGLRLETSIDLPLATTSIHLTFGLNSNSIRVTGDIQWKKTYSKTCIAGLQLQNDEALKQKIINELKEYVKRERKSGLLNKH